MVDEDTSRIAPEIEALGPVAGGQPSQEGETREKT